MIEVPGKGKGKLCSGSLNAIPDILARVDEMIEQRRVEEAHEVSPASSEETPSQNGKTTTSQPHHPAHRAPTTP